MASEKWKIIHAYREAYLNDEVPWPECPDCQAYLRVVLDLFDEPALRCDSCNTTWLPGTAVWSQLRSNLNERN